MAAIRTGAASSPRPAAPACPSTSSRAAVRIGGIVLFESGQPHDANAEKAAAHLSGKDIDIEVDLGTGGTEQATIWTCDLSAEYVRINADYRT